MIVNCMIGKTEVVVYCSVIPGSPGYYGYGYNSCDEAPSGSEVNISKIMYDDTDITYKLTEAWSVRLHTDIGERYDNGNL